MDLNQTIEFTPSSTPSPEVHNFMPMPSFMSPHYHLTAKEDREEDRHSRLVQMLRQNLEVFWNQQMFDILNISGFKSRHQLPLARIKRIMKSGGDVKMISADTPILFSKACELFVLELTLRAWLQTEQTERRTLHRCDFARAVRLDEAFNFLVHVVPLDDHEKEKAEKSSEETEPNPANQLHFPVMNAERESIVKNEDVSETFMIIPSVPSAELKHEPAFK